MLKVGLGDLVLGELGDLAVVHLDAVDAGELLDGAPRSLVECMWTKIRHVMCAFNVFLLMCPKALLLHFKYSNASIFRKEHGFLFIILKSTLK